MWVTWSPIIPAVLIALAVIIIPGGVIASALRLPIFHRVTLAPVFSTLAIGVSAWIPWLVGSPWGIWWLIGCTTIIAATLFGINALIRRTGKTATVLLRTPTPMSAHESWQNLWQYLVGIALIIVVMLPRYLRVIGSPDSVLQRFDNVFHVNAIAWIARNNQAAPPALGWMVNSDIYPLGWHQFNALTMSLSSLSVTGTIFACFFVTIFITWPLGLAVLLESVTRTNPWTRLAVGPLSLSFMTFPHMTLDGGGIYANLFGLSLAPATLAVIVAVAQVGQRSYLGFGQALVAAVFAILGTSVAHPNAAMLVAAASLPALWLSAWQVRQREETDTGRPVPPWLWQGAVVLATVLLGVAWIVLAPGLEVAPWPGFQTIPQSVGEVIFGTSMAKQAIWGGAFVLIIGVLLIVSRHRSLWWLLAVHLIIASFYIITSAFGASILRNWISGVFYNDARRTGSALGITYVTIAAVGVGETMLVATGLLRKYAPRLMELVRPHEKLTAIIIALLLAINTVPSAGLRAQLNTLSDVYAYRTEGIDELLYRSERNMVEKVAEIVPEDEVVANIPLDGSGLIYAMANRRVLNYYMFQREDDEVDYINRHLNRVTKDDKVCPLLEKHNITYVVNLDPQMIGNYDYRDRYRGLKITQDTPGFEHVVRRGESSLYRITACD